MPWKDTCPVDERMKFVMDWERGELSMSGLCRAYGISRPTGYKWMTRYTAGGLKALHDRSRAPRHHPLAVSPTVEEVILAARYKHPTWGPKKIRALLEAEDRTQSWPACSTIGDILKRHGLTVPRKLRRRTPPQRRPFAECNAPNTVWCADFKGWFQTLNGARCEPLTITDAHSRYILRCQAMTNTGYEPVRSIFEAVFREHGLPHAIRTDNGSPFASRGIGGLSRLSVWWIQLGIVPERIEPGEPQQNGRHERMHLTLKQETASPPARTLRAQQRAFDRFRDQFNNERPHEGLGMRCPAEVYSPSAIVYPQRPRRGEYPPGLVHRIVQARGEFYWNGHKVFLGEAFIGQRIALEPLHGRHWLIYFRKYPLGLLDSREHEVLKDKQAVKACVRLGIIPPPRGSSATLQSLLAAASVVGEV